MGIDNSLLDLVMPLLHTQQHTLKTDISFPQASLCLVKQIHVPSPRTDRLEKPLTAFCLCSGGICGFTGNVTGCTSTSCKTVFIRATIMANCKWSSRTLTSWTICTGSIPNSSLESPRCTLDATCSWWPWSSISSSTHWKMEKNSCMVVRNFCQSKVCSPFNLDMCHKKKHGSNNPAPFSHHTVMSDFQLLTTPLLTFL